MLDVMLEPIRRAADDATRRPPGRVDASMDLLNQIIRQPLDPDYARGGGPGPARPALPLGSGAGGGGDRRDVRRGGASDHPVRARPADRAERS